MADVVNLNRYRKAREKAQAQLKAEENRRRHGLTKAEKEAGQKLHDKAEADLDGKRLDD